MKKRNKTKSLRQIYPLRQKTKNIEGWALTRTSEKGDTRLVACAPTIKALYDIQEAYTRNFVTGDFGMIRCTITYEI